MITTENKNETRFKPIPIEDQLGSLAESARRHLAYLALAEQIATSENALQEVLDSIERRRAAARLIVPTERTYDRDKRN